MLPSWGPRQVVPAKIYALIFLNEVAQVQFQERNLVQEKEMTDCRYCTLDLKS